MNAVDEVGPSLPVGAPLRRILIASLAGTTIEFFDFYIYATAAVLVFPKLFFPRQDPNAALLESFATFALAFFARPVGSALFGHFGDRIGRKATLVTALLTMGGSTVLIGLLPTYASIGVLAPVLLALCRFGQGLGLGGEWGGAVLLATENAPPGRGVWYSSFPQLGAPLGFILAGGTFMLLTAHLSAREVLDYGWRWPFLASTLMVAIGLYVRLQLVETPAFKRSIARGERVAVPLLEVLRLYGRTVVLGTFGSATTFTIFYLTSVFALTWGTTALGFNRTFFLEMQLLGVLFFGMFVPVSAILADRVGGRRMLILATIAIIVFGCTFSPLFGVRDVPRLAVFLAVGFTLTGLSYGPLGATLAELYPTAVRYTGCSVTFNLAGILGASLAPYIANRLAAAHGVGAAGLYLSALGLISLGALLLLGPPASPVGESASKSAA